MKKRLYILALLALTASINASAYDLEVDGIYYDVDFNNMTASVTYKTTEYNSYSGDVEIPASITYNTRVLTVTSIGDYAFAYCSSLTSVTIPNSVTSIGNYAFFGCSSLTSVTIPNSVTSIGDYAFEYCSSLTSVTIPNSVTIIGGGAFECCSSLTSVTIPNSVTSIGDYAFEYCSSLTSVTIPNSVTIIGGGAFECCSSLTSVTIPNSVTSIGGSAFANCSSLTSVTIPNSVTFIGGFTFYNCSSLTSVTIPNSVTSIGDYAFYKCSLTSVTIPNSVTSIGDNAFEYCSLTSVTIPNSVTSIGDYAFAYCRSLTSVTIPNSVTSIGDYAFADCRSLTSVTIPNSVTSIGDYAFADCTLTPLYLFAKLSSYSKCFKQLSTSSVIFAYSSEMVSISKYWSGTVHDITVPYGISVSSSYLRGVRFSLVGNDYIKGALQSVSMNGTELSSDENGEYYVTGLEFGTSYDIIITYTYTADEGETYTITKTVQTKEPTVSITRTNTQTTLTISVTASEDKTCTADLKGFVFEGKTYEYTGTPVTISRLEPKTQYSVTPFAYYGDTKVTGSSTTCTTAGLYPSINQVETGPTSVTLTGSYTEGDATVSETGFTDYNTSNTLELTGLEPETKYTFTYHVKTEEGSNETATANVTTSSLELTTLTPKVVSETCAIVAATTNISEDETNVGFQWIKYDAPSTLAPSEGYSAIYDGQLEGYIKNLQATYYNVRAFYKSGSDTYYYGDWVTFDQTDYSYFEPTVHTYAVQGVTDTTASVKGYAMSGTYEITSQGFEYWSSDSGSSKAKAVHAANVSDGVSIIYASGQVMTATIEGLSEGTTYTYRAFVTTSEGTTYGEEQTFTTTNVTGIAVVKGGDSATPTVTGYYDLGGRKHETPQRGVNIIRYSDGTARKVFVK